MAALKQFLQFSSFLSVSRNYSSNLCRFHRRKCTIVVPKGHAVNQNVFKMTRCLHTSSQTFTQENNEPNPFKKQPKRRPLSLMEDMPLFVWPNPLKTLRNWFFCVLISRYFDNTFQRSSFLEGSLQAIKVVSNIISQGKFEDLNGLVDSKVIPEIKQSYNRLVPEQRKQIQVNPEDFFYKFLYEIGIMMEDESNKRFVEITVVAHGIHGYHNVKVEDKEDVKDKMFICNYRFIREFTKGVEDDWIINQLNHFSPKELANYMSPFDR